MLINQVTLLKNPPSQWIPLTIHYDVVAAQQQKVHTVLGVFMGKKFADFFPGIMVTLKLLL